MGAHGRYRGTPKQRAVLKMLLEAADAGGFMRAKDLCDRFPDTTVQATYSTVDTLERWGFLVKDGVGRKGQLLKPTAAAYRFRNRL